MDLPWKIKLIDYLIRKDPEHKIKDYLEIRRSDVELIESKNAPCPSDVTPKMTTAVLKNCAIAV